MYILYIRKCDCTIYSNINQYIYIYLIYVHLFVCICAVHHFNVSQSYAMTASSIYSSPLQHQSGWSWPWMWKILHNQRWPPVLRQAHCGTSTSMILLWYQSAWISAKLRHCISPNPESLNCFGHFSVDSSDKPPFRVRSFPSAECSRVNHQCNSRNVNPTWCNIRCNQHTWRSCANDRVGHPRRNWNLKMNNSNSFEIENWE